MPILHPPCSEHRQQLAGLRLIRDYSAVLINLVTISLGCVIFAMALNGIMIPYRILSGGLVGIAQLVQHYLPSVNVAWTYLLLNIPLLILGWQQINRSFMLYSIYGAIFFSLTAGVITMTPPKIDDPILASLLAGIVAGLGSGIILRSAGSAGGLDILSVVLNRHFGVRIGAIAYTINGAILLAGSRVWGIQSALYALIFLFVSTKTIDVVVYGLNSRKSMLIISDHAGMESSYHESRRDSLFQVSAGGSAPGAVAPRLPDRRRPPGGGRS